MVPQYYPYLALLLVEGFGAADCFRLPGGNAAETFEMLKSPTGRSRLSLHLGRPIGRIPWAAFERQLDAVASAGARVVTYLDKDYPRYLDDIGQRPPLLFCKGDMGVLGRRGVAIVGTRRASARGCELARALAADLSRIGIHVVSGAARGIDSAAHRGALAAAGRTVGVTGTGLDRVYPEENTELLQEIARNGCLVSEQLMGTPPLAHVFPRRNRLISAFSHAVVVVEAGRKSGALITVKWALEQGRDVGAVPGVPGDHRAAGVNALIKSGAFLVEGVEDVLAAVPKLEAHAAGRCSPPVGDVGRRDGDQERDVRLAGLSREAKLVFGALGPSPADPDSVASGLGEAIAVVQPALLELEMRGLARRDPLGNYYLAKEL